MARRLEGWPVRLSKREKKRSRRRRKERFVRSSRIGWTGRLCCYAFTCTCRSGTREKAKALDGRLVYGLG